MYYTDNIRKYVKKLNFANILNRGTEVLLRHKIDLYNRYWNIIYPKTIASSFFNVSIMASKNGVKFSYKMKIMSKLKRQLIRDNLHNLIFFYHYIISSDIYIYNMMDRVNIIFVWVRMFLILNIVIESVATIEYNILKT